MNVGEEQDCGGIQESNPQNECDLPAHDGLLKNKASNLDDEEEDEFVVVEAHGENRIDKNSQSSSHKDEQVHGTIEPGVASSSPFSSQLENPQLQNKEATKVEVPFSSDVQERKVLTCFESPSNVTQSRASQVSRTLVDESQKSIKASHRTNSSSSISVNTMDCDEDDLDGASSVDVTLDDNAHGPNANLIGSTETKATKHESLGSRDKNSLVLSDTRYKNSKDGSYNSLLSTDSNYDPVEIHHGGIFPDELRDSAIRTLVDSQSLLSANSGQGIHDHDGMSSLSTATAKDAEKHLSANVVSLVNEGSLKTHTKGLLIVPPAVDDAESCISSYGTDESEVPKKTKDPTSGDSIEAPNAQSKEATLSSVASIQNEQPAHNATEGQNENSKIQGIFEEYLSSIKRSVLISKMVLFFAQLSHALQAFKDKCLRALSACCVKALDEVKKLSSLKAWLDFQVSHLSLTLLSFLRNADAFRKVLLAPPSDFWILVPTAGQVRCFGFLFGIVLLMLGSVFACHRFLFSDSLLVVEHAEKRPSRHRRLIGVPDEDIFVIHDVNYLEDGQEEAARSESVDTLGRKKTTSLIAVDTAPKEWTAKEHHAMNERERDETRSNGHLTTLSGPQIDDEQKPLQDSSDVSSVLSALSLELLLHQLRHSGSCDVSMQSISYLNFTGDDMFHNCSLRDSSEWNAFTHFFDSPLEIMYSHSCGTSRSDSNVLQGSSYQDMHAMDVKEMVELYSIVSHAEGDSSGSTLEEEYGFSKGRLHALVQETLESLSIPSATTSASAAASAAMKTTARGARWLWSDFFQKGEDELTVASELLYKTVAFGLRSIPSVTSDTFTGTKTFQSEKSGGRDEANEERPEIECDDISEEEVRQPLDEVGAVPGNIAVNGKDERTSQVVGANLASRYDDNMASAMSLVSIRAQNVIVPSMFSFSNWVVNIAEAYYHKLGDVITNLQDLMIHELQHVLRTILGLAHALGYEVEVDHVLNGLNYLWSQVKNSANNRDLMYFDESSFPDNLFDDEDINTWGDDNWDKSEPTGEEKEENYVGDAGHTLYVDKNNEPWI